MADSKEPVSKFQAEAPDSAPSPVEAVETGDVAARSTTDQIVDTVVDSPIRLAIALGICLFPILTYVFVDLPPRAHIVLSLVLIATGVLVSRKAPSFRLVVVFMSIGASLRYMLFRASETLAVGSIGDMAVGALLYSAELYALATLITGYFQTAVVRRNLPLPLEVAADRLPTVDVFVPSYAESVEILRPTLLGAMAMDYPPDKLRVYLLDDGSDPGAKTRGRAEVAALCAEIGAGYLKRPTNQGFKAGNINEALPRTNGELIAFFDADHVPVRGFLRATVGFFLENARLALVQTPHHFYNPDPFERNLHIEGRVPPEQALFYHSIQLGNDFWNSAFFCGSCAVIRRTALLDVGGVAEETVTEDAHTAMKMHSKGWDSLYLDIPLAAGLATESFSIHVKQRTRWARGMAQIFRLDNPLLKRGLSLAQRLNYFNASWHFFFGLPRLIFMVVPALYLVFDFHPVQADVREVMVYAVPHLVLAALGSSSTNRNVRHSFWPEVYEVAIAPYTAMATTSAVIAPKKGQFNATAKGASSEGHSFDWRRTLWLLGIIAFAIIGVLATPAKLQANPNSVDTILVALAWNVYNLVVLTAAVAAAYERPQRRGFHRVNRAATVLFRQTAGVTAGGSPTAESNGLLIDLSLGGLAFRTQVPVDAGVTALELRLASTSGFTVPLPLDVLEVMKDGEEYVIRGRYGALSLEQNRDVAAQCFAASDTWLHDRFAFDRPLYAMLTVFLSIFASFFKNPDWVRRAMNWGRGQDGSLVPLADQSRCHACGALMIEGSLRCEACGTAVPFEDELVLTPAPLTGHAQRFGFAAYTAPVVILVIALLLSLGNVAIDKAFAKVVPLARYEQVTVKTRVNALTKAYYELRDIQDELESAVDAGSAEGLPNNWSNRLWTVRREYTLYGDTSRRPESAEIEQALYAAVLDLASAEKELREGRPAESIQPRLTSIEQHLGVAANKIGLKGE